MHSILISLHQLLMPLVLTVIQLLVIHILFIKVQVWLSKYFNTYSNSHHILLNSCSIAEVLFRYYQYVYSSDADPVIEAAALVPLSSTIKQKILNSILPNWVCSSGQSAVTSSIDVTVVVLLSIGGAIIAVASVGLVIGITIYAYIKKKKEQGNLMKDEELE